MSLLLLTVLPAQRCYYCGQLTFFAEAEIASASGPSILSVTPECYEHGYSSADEAGSIMRYVLGRYDGKGTALVIGPVRLETILGYVPTQQAEQDMPDKAWQVEYTDDQGSEHHAVVLWRTSEIRFDLASLE